MTIFIGGGEAVTKANGRTISGALIVTLAAGAAERCAKWQPRATSDERVYIACSGVNKAGVVEPGR